MRFAVIVVLSVLGACAETGSPASSLDPRGVLVHPPPPVAGAAPPEAGVSWTFAIETLHLGDALRDGTSSPEAWKTYGFDIDGKITDQRSTDVCRLATDAQSTTQVDGEGGIDNSFGANIVPILFATYGTRAGENAQASFSSGQTTNLVTVSGLGPLRDYTGLSGAARIGAPLGTTPRFGPLDMWPVDTESEPGLVFASAYMSDRVLVATSDGPGTLTLGAPDGRFLLDLPVLHLTVAMRVSDDQQTGTDGVISGIIRTEGLVEIAHTLAGRVSPLLCGGDASDSIRAQIEQASDILLDGTQDPARTCDGISLGLGFEAARVTLGTDIDVPPAPDPCLDAGAEMDAAGD